MNELELRINTLHENGSLNDFFYRQLEKKLYTNIFPYDIFKSYLEDAVAMTRLGINSYEQQKNFFWITQHVPDIIREIVTTSPGAVMAAKISARVFEKLSERPIDTLFGLFLAVARAAEEEGLVLKPEVLRSKLSKQAYPQDSSGIPLPAGYDLNHWMRATRDIYSRAQTGVPLGEAIEQVTANWGKMEKLDYKYWLRFYQEGNALKYKVAQQGYSGFYFPKPMDANDLKAELPNPFKKKEKEDESNHSSDDKNDVRDKIEQQRSRIIGRLNAAEKLLCSLDGQFFAGDDQEYMLKLLQDLKRKVQTANKIRVKSSLFEDFIYRTANFLYEEGKRKPAKFFYKIAQDPAAALLGEAPPLPGEGAPAASPEGDANSDAKKQTYDAMKEFFDRLEKGVSGDYGKDEEEVLKKASFEPAFIVVEAQGAPMAPQEDLVVEEPPETPTQKPREIDIDAIVDRALQSVTIHDVIARLELLTGLFKKREIAKQLSFVDMMLDKLGLAAFFPNLGEATRSALESNQYIATRVEEILNKLRGSVSAESSEQILNISDEDVAMNPQLAEIKQNLEQEQTREKDRRERRKAKEEAEIAQPTAAEQAPQELAQPVAVEQAQPVPMPVR